MVMVEDSSESIVRVEVRNPRTHISREKALYTDYEIYIKTNNIAFSRTESCVRRRYSNFQWLNKRLLTLYNWATSIPALPPKQLFGRFQRAFLKRRQQDLQIYLERIVEENQYLSDVAVHLFLQSNLSIKEIERRLDGSDLDHRDSRQSRLTLSCSMAEIPVENLELCAEQDSGFCYSTVSSINDLIHPLVTKTREDWYDYIYMPASLDEVAVNNTLEQSEQNGCRWYVSSGNLISESYQSSTKGTGTSKSSDADLMYSGDYEADCESNIGKDGVCEDEGSLLLELDNKTRLEQALTLLQSRPKISERILTTDESDDEFNESEYDVIHSYDLYRKNLAIHKQTRSVSDVLKRKPKKLSEPHHINDNQHDDTNTCRSTPSISAHLPARSKEKKSLKSQREEDFDAEKHFSNASEGQFDDADENVLPNSEMDCYSTLSRPRRITVDSSDAHLNFDHSTEKQSRYNIARSLLERLTLNRHSDRLAADKATVVNGRFHVSVIFEQ